jgi:hypothetical protein
MGNLCLGFPLYHQVPASWFGRYVAMDKSSVVNHVIVNGAYVLTSMQIIVGNALEMDNWDRLVIFEHDMLPPEDALERIAAYEPEHEIVGSVYFKRVYPHEAVIYTEAIDGSTYLPLNPDSVAYLVDNPRLHPAGAVGFGFTSIARHVLEKWDPDIPMFGMDNRVGSHDIWFCDRATQQGFNVFVDSSIVCEHLMETPIGLAHNQYVPKDQELSDAQSK